MQLLDNILAPYVDQGLVGYLILIADDQGQPPTSAFCKQYQANFGFQKLRLLYDPTGATGTYGPKETTVVTNADGYIAHKSFGDSADVGETIRQAVEAILQAAGNE